MIAAQQNFRIELRLKTEIKRIIFVGLDKVNPPHFRLQKKLKS